MLKFKCNIKGMDKLEEKLNIVIKELPKKVEKVLERVPVNKEERG